MKMNVDPTMDVNTKETFLFVERITHTTMSPRRTSCRFSRRMATSISIKTRRFESRKERELSRQLFATLVATRVVEDAVRKMPERLAI